MKDSTKNNILLFVAIAGIIILVLGAINKNIPVMKAGRLTILAALIFRALLAAKKK